VVSKVNSLRNSGFRAGLAFEAKTYRINLQAIIASLFHYLSQFRVSDGPQDKCVCVCVCGGGMHERK
jgi:hypothetical protein